MKKTVLFIGLGRMGYPMAGHIAKSEDFSVSVYNRSPLKIEQWLTQHKGSTFDATLPYNYIILCVGNDEDIKGIFEDTSPFVASMNNKTVIVDHTTTSAHLPKTLNEQLNKKGIFYLDAPVSGGEAGAMGGVLTCMVGGDHNKFDHVKALLECYCKNITYIGSSGSGQIAKMANQFCIAGTLAGLSEAITLLKKESINTDLVYNAIKNGAAQSWQMDNRFKTMVQGDFDFGFSITHMIKDLKYAIEHARNQSWDPVFSKKILSCYEKLLSEGYSAQDTSVLIKKY